MNMLTELKNRGIVDVGIVCCDELKGLPGAIEGIWPLATVQTCVVHLVRQSLRYTSTSHWQKITPQLRRIYTAPTLEAAEDELGELQEQWGHTYPAMIKLWRSSWEQFVPFLDFPPEVRNLIYTTNAIESLNARFRAAVTRRGHFPDEQSALKVLYLACIAREKNPRSDRGNPTGQIKDWKTVLNVLLLTYGDRLYPTN
jgi:transposase-like protein